MSIFRKIPVWLMLASYLFANTVVSSLHEHRDCCGHSEIAGESHGTADCAMHDHGDHHCQNHQPGQKDDDDNRQVPPRCVVCDFLALAPISAPQAALASTGEVLPEFAIQHGLLVAGTTLETHLARGPPAL